ncbi:MAG: acyltransferase family protein [Prevotella sp.]|nr:acyltransferase family protein [Prevotella sp.]
MAKQRIEYIDAMRGLTMILVVFSHICNYCLGDKWMGYNDVFFLFRMPCFFFISGWLFAMPDRQWNGVSVRTTVRHKFRVQIIPTVIFLLLLAPPPLFFTRLGALKGGYWFTFALFEFFLLCIFSERYLKRWGALFAVSISVAAFCYDVFYSRYFSSMGLLTKALGFLGFITWRYYLFFFIGTWVKCHFNTFVRLTGKPWVIAFVTAGFICVALMPHVDDVFVSYLVFAFGGITGMIMVFTFFRVFSAAFSKQKVLGKSLQYIGTRTLDIYLLHYFVLPRFLLPFGEQLRAYGCKPVEFSVAICLSLAVVAVCLLASYIIRLNPFFGHWLFGVKYEQRS